MILPNEHDSVLLKMLPKWALDSALFNARVAYIGNAEPPSIFEDTVVQGNWSLERINGCLSLWEDTYDDNGVLTGRLLLLGDIPEQTAQSLIELNPGEK